MTSPNDEHSQHQDPENEPEHNGEESSSPSDLKHNKSEAVSPGEMLREGRLEQDYTVEDLCAQTKLNKHTIEALEDNDFETLPQPVFTRGYYRRCAAVLDLDEDRLMAAYTAYAGETEALQLNQPVHIEGTAVGRRAGPGKSRFRGLLLFLILAAAVIAAVVYLMSPNSPLNKLGQNENATDGDQFSTVTSVDTVDNDQDTQTASTEQNETPEPAAGNNASAETNDSDDATARQSMNDQPGADQQTSADGEGQSETAASDASDETHHTGGRNLTEAFGIDTDGGTEGSESSDESSEENAEPEVAPNVLTLSFSKASWVKVTDASGKQLTQGTYKAGQEKQFEGKPPYKVTLGFAPGVKATIGGQAVDIDAQSGGKIVAHLTIKAANENE